MFRTSAPFVPGIQPQSRTFGHGGGGAFDPAAYGTPILYEDADDISGSIGSGFSTWPFNTYGSNAVTTSGRSNPTLESGPNGHQSVDFGGNASMVGNLVYAGTTISVASVMLMRNATAIFCRIIDLGVTGIGNTGSALYAIPILRDGTSNAVEGFRNGSILSNLPISLDTWVVLVSEFDGTNQTMTINGTSGTPVASAGTFGIANFFLGDDTINTGNFFSGQQACNIIYSSLTNKSGLISALRSKYAI